KTRMRAQGVTPPSSPRRSGSSAPAAPAESNTGAAASSAKEEAAGASRSSETESSRKREISLTPVQQLERAIAADPTLVENYLELANLYIEEHKFADAQRVLQRGQQASPGATDLLEKMDELNVRRAKHQLKIAEKRAAAEDTP